MPRIILQYPFMRHYAGSVFDLEENLNRSDNESDDRLYDRLSPKRNYFLPDSGKGFSIDLPISNTVLCPPSVFEGVDLTTGPCRITSAITKSNNNAEIPFENLLNIDKVQLFDIENHEKQSIKIELPTQSPIPQRLQIIERKGNLILKDITVNDYVLTLDCMEFTNGFYEIRILCKGDIYHNITFIKCFPLVVTVDLKTNQLSTMKTIY